MHVYKKLRQVVSWRALPAGNSATCLSCPYGKSHEAAERRGNRRFRAGPGPGHAPGHWYDRRGLGQTADRGGVIVERGHAVQPAARPAGQAGQGRSPRGRRLPDRVRHHRRIRRHLDGPRGHESVPGQPGGDSRLRRARDARRTFRRDGHFRRLRQVPARYAHGRRSGQPPGGVSLRRVDPAGPRTARRGSGHHQRLRGGRSPGCRDSDRRGADPHRAERLPHHRQLRRHVHRQHHGVGVGSPRHGPARVSVALGYRPGATIWPGNRARPWFVSSLRVSGRATS